MKCRLLRTNEAQEPWCSREEYMSIQQMGTVVQCLLRSRGMQCQQLIYYHILECKELICLSQGKLTDNYSQMAANFAHFLLLRQPIHSVGTRLNAMISSSSFPYRLMRWGNISNIAYACIPHVK